MLPKANRLKHRQDFNAVYQQVKRPIQSDRLTLRARRHQERDRQGSHAPESQPTRFGISISQKVSKKAVIRNRIKRQIRAALRQLLPRLLPGWDCVIVVKPTTTPKCNYEEFLQELEQLLAAVEVLDGHSRRNIL